MYLIGERRIEPEDIGFSEALAEAHALRWRPRCLCKAPGIEMYVARLGGDFLVKRMPYTGSQHAPDCSSYEPPLELCADGHRDGTAIVEDPETGMTNVRVEFALSRRSRGSISRFPDKAPDCVRRHAPALSLGGFLHFLWSQAGLTRWRPEFEGKRNWATVRRLLLNAAASMIVKGEGLRDRIFVPETFAVERREEIGARRAELFRRTALRAAEEQRLLLLCAEVKEISPARHGCSAVIKHVPDQPFALDDQLFRRMEDRFERELSLWGAGGGCHLITLATFGIGPAGIPTIEQLGLMPVDARWIPIVDVYDLRLVERLVEERRRFIKVVPTHSSSLVDRASIVLTDVGELPALLRLSTEVSSELRHFGSAMPPHQYETWTWQAGSEAMPVLPPPAQQAR
jgi:hypothetical protein